jgi:hypothetical protein
MRPATKRHPIVNARERRAANQLLLNLLRIYREYIGTKDAVTPLIACAVVLGHADGRPMNQSNIAKLLGIKRQTVARKLQQLINRHFIVRDGDEYFVAPHIAESPPERLAQFAAIIGSAYEQWGAK